MLFSALACAAPAQASYWPLAGGGPARAGVQAVEPGVLPAPPAWSSGGETVRTPAVITGGDGPAAQRVAYATADGHVHLRVLATGAAVGPAGGTEVADATVTDPETAFTGAGGLASSSTDTAPGILYAVHNDGPGIEIARFDERTGARTGPDVAVADSFGCTVAGAPLLTPVAADGSRLLFFTVGGNCESGPALVRVPLAAGGTLGAPAFAPVSGLIAGVAPALVVTGSPPRFTVAVARTGGLDLRRADGDYAGPRDGAVELGADPAALAAPETQPLATPAIAVLAGSRVLRLDQAADGSLSVAATQALTGSPVGLAIGGATDERLVATTSAGVTVLRAADLGVVGTAAGNYGPPSASGGLAFVAGGSGPVAISLDTAKATPLPGPSPPAFAPALARGYVTFGPAASRTTDVSAPSVSLASSGLRHLDASAGDDRGVARVAFRLSGRRLATVKTPVSGSAFAPGARYATAYDPRRVPPGHYQLTAVAFDAAGNSGRAQHAVSVSCQRTLRGGRGPDVLRGTSRRDCLYGGPGRDRILARDHSPDFVSCGSGRDVAVVDPYDRVADDCERVRRPRR